MKDVSEDATHTVKRYQHEKDEKNDDETKKLLFSHRVGQLRIFHEI